MIEGKIANRNSVKSKGLSHIVNCERCKKSIPSPEMVVIQNQRPDSVGDFRAFICQSYAGTEYFVYEVQSGDAICYCSKWCAKKHNHRFRSKK